MLIKTPCFELKTLYLNDYNDIDDLSIYTYIIEFPKVTSKHRKHIIKCILNHLKKTNKPRYKKVIRHRAKICVMPIIFDPEQSTIHKPFICNNYDNGRGKMAINAVGVSITDDWVLNKLDMFYITNKSYQVGFGIGRAPVKRNIEELKIERAYSWESV